MATATKTFLLDTTEEYDLWTVDTVVDVTVSHNTADTDADGSGDAGQVQAILSTKNRNRTGHIRISQTWEDIGVPAGATVTHCQVVYAERQYTNAQSSNSDSGPFTIRNSANDGDTLELLAALNRTATSNYADRDSGTLELPASEASDTAHWFRLTHRLQTPNTNGAEVGIRHDHIRITATYEQPQAYTLTAEQGSFNLSGQEVGLNYVGSEPILKGPTFMTNMPVIGGGSIYHYRY